MDTETTETFFEEKIIDRDKDMEVSAGNVKKVAKSIRRRITPRIFVPFCLANGMLIQASRPDSECDFPLITAFVVIGGVIIGIYMLKALITHASSWVLKDRTIDKVERRVLKFLRGLMYLSYLIQIIVLLGATFWLVTKKFSKYNGKSIVIDTNVEEKNKLCQEFLEESPNEECPFQYCDYFAYQFALYIIYAFWFCLGMTLIILSYIYIANMYYHEEL